MKLLKIGRAGEKSKTELDTSSANILPLPKNILGISDGAAKHLNFLLTKTHNINQYLRVAIKGGGCSGLTICYEFCESTRPNDLIFEHNSARICIDPKSLG